MDLKLMQITDEDLKQFKQDMQEAFLIGALEGGFPSDTEEILPEADIERSLSSAGAIAYKAVEKDKMLGGAIIVIDKEKKRGHLDFLYVKHGIQNRGIGKFIWFEIERLHTDVCVWETCTPYFEKRNLHFYVNVCGFYITEYWNSIHKDRNAPLGEDYSDDGGMFGFRKEINRLESQKNKVQPW